MCSCYSKKRYTHALLLAACILLNPLVISSQATENEPQSSPSPDSSTPSNGSPSQSTANPLPPPDDTSPCGTNDHGDSNDPPLPTLDDQFETRVEATIMNGAYTVEVVEYYDFTNNRGAVYKTKKGVEEACIYNFQGYEAFLLQNNTCTTFDMRKQTFRFFNFTIGSKGGHISGVADLFNFGTQYNETFISDNETVRGIPVRRWRSCLEWEQYQAVFTLDFYFSHPDYNVAVGRQEIPVRAVVQGISQSTEQKRFHHVYDFVFYRPGPIKDQSVFQIPEGVVCNRLSNGSRTRPVLPDKFSMAVEIVHPQQKYISQRKLYFDYEANLTRTDLRPSTKSMTDLGESFGYKPLSIIHDYSTGLEYVIDLVRENCTMRKIVNTTVDSVSDPQNPNHILMKHGKDLFDLQQLDLQYQGQRMARGTLCDLWAVNRINWPPGANTTVETLFLQDEWSSEAGLIEQHHVIVTMTMNSHGLNRGKPYTTGWVQHISDYVVGEPHLDVFDVGPCFSRREEMMHLMFRIPGQYNEIVRGEVHNLRPAVRQCISSAVNISPIRVHDIYFDASSVKNVDVWFTLLERPTLKGIDTRNVIDMKTAYTRLKELIDSDDGLRIVVSHGQNQQSMTLKVKPKSLVTNQEAFDPREQAPSQSNYRGYTPGSMAALGICMVILGLMAGLLFAFFWCKRPMSGVPYQIQD